MSSLLVNYIEMEASIFKKLKYNLSIILVPGYNMIIPVFLYIIKLFLFKEACQIASLRGDLPSSAVWINQ